MNSVSVGIRILRRFWMNSQSLFYKTFGRNYMCGCGHMAKQKTLFIINKCRGVYTLDKSRDYCPQCWRKAAIKCAWCGEIILPGEPITLYTPREGVTVPEYAVVYKEAPLQLVGCLRWDCADTGASRAGFWVMPGKVQRVASPLEMLIAGVPSGSSEAIVVNDISDPSETIPIDD